MKRRYQGVCRGCGAPTTARGGKGDAYEFCKRCHPGAIAPTRTREWVRDAMHDWRQRYGRPPSSTDWSRTHAGRRGGEALEAIRKPETGLRRRPSSTSTGPGPAARARRVPRRLTNSVCRGPSRSDARYLPTEVPDRLIAAQPRSRPRHGGDRRLARAVGRQPHLPARYLGLLERRRRRHSEILLGLVGVRYLRCVVVVLRVAGSTGPGQPRSCSAVAAATVAGSKVAERDGELLSERRDFRA